MKYVIICCATVAVAGCGESSPADPQSPDASPPDAAIEDPDAAPAPETVGRCVYTNPFSMGEDCKGYTGAGWTAASASEDCAAVIGAVAGEFTAGAACEFAAELGRCAVGDPAADGYVTVSSGADPGQCGLTQTACENFAQGVFSPGSTCTAEACEPPTEVTGRPFVQPYETCVMPPAGDEEVCTPVIISGCTEPGRKYAEFGACEDVLTQRPYAAYGDPPEVDPADPRLADDEYLGELAWVTEQIESCACNCCHTGSVTPNGAGAWDTEAGPLWIDMMTDEGLAMMAGLVDSTSFGAVDPALNNGFDRSVTGTPTTDVERMQNFLVAEYLRRGNAREDAAEIRPFGGPLYAQEQFEPGPCDAGLGVRADGTLEWSGGQARYVYVLDAGTRSPGVPPNRDVPEGTRWLVEVDEATPALACGLDYGQIPEQASQRVPAEGAPEPLVEGETYYLYVLRDVGLPVTRCTFEFPAEG